MHIFIVKKIHNYLLHSIAYQKRQLFCYPHINWIFVIELLYPLLEAWASADFFPGEGKIFQGGAKTYYLPNKHQKRYYFRLKKSIKHTILASQGGSRAPSCPPLRTPMIKMVVHKFEHI